MCGSEIGARRALEEAIAATGSDSQGWWVLNSLLTKTKNGNTDIDLLVGIPNTGLLIIEVKGWTHFAVDGQGRWTRSGKDGKTPKEGPYKQADREEYLLLDKLTELQEEGLLPPGRLPRIGSCVLFGNLHSNTQDLPATEKQRTLFRDTFCPSGGGDVKFFQNLLNRLQDILHNQAKPRRAFSNLPKKLAAVHTILNPMCTVKASKDLTSFADASLNQLDTMAQAAMGERAEAVNAPLLYVEGPAGTGKTVFALALAIERSKRTGRQAIYLCYSEMLAKQVRSWQWVARENVVVGTPEELFDEFGDQETLTSFLSGAQQTSHEAAELVQMAGLPEPAESILPRAYLNNESFADALLDALAASGEDFSAVVLDEAQDLLDPLIDAMSALTGPDDVFAVFADPRQTTRRERAGRPWEIPKCFDAEKAVRQTLNRNYRNGDKIIDEIESVCGIGYDLPPIVPQALVTEKTYAGRSKLAASVIETYKNLSGPGDLNPKVLVTGVGSAELKAIAAAGIEAIHVDSFKGLEHTCVILAVGPDLNPLDPSTTGEDLYVGLTRATSVLVVVRKSSQPTKFSGEKKRSTKPQKRR